MAVAQLAPTITSVSPSVGRAGSSSPDAVTIRGTNFSTTASENTVSFSGVGNGTVTSASATQLIVTPPASAVAATADVTVANADGTATATTAYTYVVAPTISASFNPTLIARTSGTSTLTLTISNTNFVTLNQIYITQSASRPASYPACPRHPAVALQRTTT